MCRFLTVGTILILSVLLSCSDSNDLSVEKKKRVAVTDQTMGAVHLFLDGESENVWLSSLNQYYPKDSNLFFRDRYLSAHTFVFHSRNEISVSELNTVRIGILQNFKPRYYDTSIQFKVHDSKLIAFKNACAQGQWLIDISNVDLAQFKQSDWTELKLMIDKLSNDLSLDGYFERYHPTDYIRGIQSEIESIWNLSIQLPNDWKVFGTDTGFLWLGKLNTNGGFLGLWISEIPGRRDKLQLSEHIELKNSLTKKYFHNDEGTKMVVSEIPSFKSLKIEPSFFRGWYTEEATTRRGPYFTKYIYNSRKNSTLIVEVFCPESENMANETEFLKHLINSVSFVP